MATDGSLTNRCLKTTANHLEALEVFTNHHSTPQQLDFPIVFTVTICIHMVFKPHFANVYKRFFPSNKAHNHCLKSFFFYFSFTNVLII